VVDAALVTVFLALLVNRWLIGIDVPLDIADPLWGVPLLACGDLALLWRRTHPLAAILGFFGAYALHAVLSGHGVEGLFALLPALVALYSLGAYAVGRQLVWGIAGVLVLNALHDTHDPGIQLSDPISVWGYLFWSLFILSWLLVGLLVGTRRRAGAERLRAAEAEARRAEAVASERAKIARELHDVVTHNVNVVVMQAMAAHGVLDTDPERVRAPLEAIESSGREALSEMRRMLGVLREETEPLWTPQPGATDVGRLVEQLTNAGQEVTLVSEGDLDALPDGMGMVVFRIAQEALTNAMKHARGAPVAVRVSRTTDAVEVEVTNPAGVPEPQVSGAGHGLVGMTERAALFGGTVVTGPTPGGGFRVSAHLPLEHA
jgi:signal transduction histidine kinase